MALGEEPFVASLFEKPGLEGCWGCFAVVSSFGYPSLLFAPTSMYPWPWHPCNDNGC